MMKGDEKEVVRKRRYITRSPKSLIWITTT